VFNDDTPYELIRTILPDILVKGSRLVVGCNCRQDVVEAAGGAVRTIEFVPDRSSSSIIDTILKRYS